MDNRTADAIAWGRIAARKMNKFHLEKAAGKHPNKIGSDWPRPTKAELTVEMRKVRSEASGAPKATPAAKASRAAKTSKKALSPAHKAAATKRAAGTHKTAAAKAARTRSAAKAPQHKVRNQSAAAAKAWATRRGGKK